MTAPAPATTPFDAKVAAAKGAMMSDPGIALANARQAIAIGKATPNTAGVVAAATGHWLEGEALVRLNRVAEAVPIIDGAIRAIARAQPGSKLHADLLKSKAAIVGNQGDIQKALTLLHDAHALYAKLGEARSQAMVFQNVGSIYLEARDYPRTLYYYELADEAFGEDPKLSLTSHNNRGNAYKEMGKFGAALKEYQTALTLARAIQSPLLEARIMTNIASAQLMMGDLRAADAQAIAGLRRATGDATEWRPYLWGVRAQVAYKRGDLFAAHDHMQRTFAGADLNTTSPLFRDFHETAYALYEKLGRPGLALRHLKAFKRLDDEGRGLAASAEAALLSARFDNTNQELRIARLKAARMSDEVKLAQSDQRLRQMTLVGLIGAAAALAIIIAVLFGLAAARRARRSIAAANAQLQHAASHDGLTRMANRGQLRELMGATLIRSAEQEHGCAIFLIDLDRFKAVNDTLGHQAGDVVLCAVAERLNALFDGRGHAGRLGGDEFGAVLPFADPGDEPTAVAAAIIEELARPIDVAGTPVFIGATVGMATFPLDARSVDDLIRCADLALYRAKEEGRGRCTRYIPEMQIEIDERRELERDLRCAIDRGELAIAYQPIVDATSAQVIAYEALLRWQHPTRGNICPSLFIPIAEGTQQIGEIGKWVLRSACAEAATWPAHVRLAVNLSAIQIDGADLTATVIHALATHGLAPRRLELEVTESIFLRPGPNTEATLGQLQSLGVSLALDDFGTGFSSLAYLQRASFSTIKIDRMFVQSAAEGRKESLSIIRAIVALASGLGMATTAEGVETIEQMDLMRELGCTQLQGFHLGRPELSQRDQTTPIELPILLPPRREIRRAS
ncbi:MAG: EAL domain-containing protein [Sphingomonas bacterium]|nr:EAL domain-containing protein [Sphingomonas bacterium]